MWNFTVQELLPIPVVALVAFASIGWSINSGASLLKTIFVAGAFLTLWIGLYIAQYLVGDTVSDFMNRTAGPTFCKLVPIELCDIRREQNNQKTLAENAKIKALVKSGLEDEKRAASVSVDSGRSTENRSTEVSGAEKKASEVITQSDPPQSLPVVVIRAPAEERQPPPITGDRYELEGSRTYRIDPAIDYTTTIVVLAGAVTLYIDGKQKLECPNGYSFRVFTRGWSRFDFMAAAEGATIEIAELVQGDLTEKAIQ